MKSQKSWAYLLIAIGVLMLIKRIMHIDVNIFMLLISGILIYTGYILINSKSDKAFGDNLIFFSSVSQEATKQDLGFTTLFSERSIYLNSDQVPENALEINSIFSETKLFIPENLPVVVKGRAYFAECSFPDGREVNFGEKQYAQNITESTAALRINSFSLFAETKIIRVKIKSGGQV